MTVARLAIKLAAAARCVVNHALPTEVRMTSATRVFALCLVCCVDVTASDIGVEAGDSRSFWSHCAVVVVVVVVVRIQSENPTPPASATGWTKMYVNPIVANVTTVVATEIPVQIEDKIELNFSMLGAFPPYLKKGNIAIACITLKDHKWFLDENGVDFLKNNTSMLVISQMPQPKIDSIFANIRKCHDASMHSRG